jgi:membrane-associated phospholipid phosphatase
MRRIKLLKLLFMLIIIMVIRKISIEHMSDTYKIHNDKNKLYDLLQHVLPDLENNKLAVATYNIFPTVIMLFAITKLIMYDYNTDKPEIFLLCKIIFFITKIILGNITILPDSSQRCNTNYLFGSCHELIPSGHIGNSIISLYFIDIHIQSKIFIIASLSFLSIMTKKHYSIDVVIGIYISITILYFVTTHIKI